MDDDIFSESKEDKDKEDSNMDWKKSGIDKHERLTLKINVKEANLYNAGEKRDANPRAKVRAPKEVPQGFKKIRKKIRDAYDDEEDDDDYILVPVFMDKEMSSLEKALTPEERKQLQQMESPVAEDIRLRQSVERDMQLQRAEEIIKKTGLEVDRKVTEQQRNKTKAIEIKDLTKENLKKSKEKDILNLKESKTEKPAKDLPKIKNAEEKEVRKAVMDDAEKDKKSVKKNLQKQQQEKNETNAVTKEKPAEEKQKQTEEPKIEQAKKEEQMAVEEKQALDEKTAREIILEKSGRTTKKEQENQQHQEEIQKERELERGARERDDLEHQEYQNQHIFQRSGRSR